MRILLPNPESIRIALSVLETGGIVIHSTETCYGLACDLTNAEAVARVFLLKERPPEQLVSALFSSVAQAKQYVLWNDQAETLAEKYLPGPLTMILPLRTDTPLRLFPIPPKKLSGVRCQVSGDGDQRILEAGSCHSALSSWPKGKLEATLGVRISSHPIAQELVYAFGRPISTTSANIHGRPAAYAPEEILLQFPNDLSDVLLLDGGILPHCPPSTIIDLTGPSPREVRRGDTIASHVHEVPDRVFG